MKNSISNAYKIHAYFTYAENFLINLSMFFNTWFDRMPFYFYNFSLFEYFDVCTWKNMWTHKKSFYIIFDTITWRTCESLFLPPGRNEMCGIIACPHMCHRDQSHANQTKWSADWTIDRSCEIALVVGNDTGGTAVDHGWEWVEPRCCSTRVDVLESYRDKKGHPKDTPDSERRNAITIDIDTLNTHYLCVVDDAHF